MNEKQLLELRDVAVDNDDWRLVDEINLQLQLQFDDDEPIDHQPARGDRERFYTA